MRLPWRRTSPTDGTPAALPPDVFAELIESLYAPYGAFVLGAICSILVGIVLTGRTGNTALAACTVLLALVAIGRVMLIFAYRSRRADRTDDTDALRRWERRYAVGAWLFAATLGGLGLVCFLTTDDPVAYLLVYAIIVGYAGALSARNSVLPRLAIGQLVLILPPVALGAALQGGAAYLVLSALTVCHLLATIEIVRFLGNRSLRLLLTTREKTELARSLAAQNLRFDAALGNMSHGLCMFDRRGRLMVSNARLCVLFGLPEGTFVPGMTVRDMLERSAAAGNHPDRTAVAMAAEYGARLAGGTPSSSKMSLRGGERTILLSQWPIADGGVVVLFEDVTERERAEARAQYLATHDDLTGLPNRTMFSATLDEAIGAAEALGQRFAVLFMDLDRFKFVNDTLGHAAGDELLEEVAARLRGCLHEGDVVSRLGGDEFVILLRSTSDVQRAEIFARRLLSTIVKPIVVLGQECRVAASIGVAFYPDDGRDEQTLTRNADAAMYLAKEEGRNCVRFFSPMIETRSIERLMLETSLRCALERKEFVVHYQPKKDLATGAVSGAEALLRWNHPELGLVLPGRFIPLAEDTGLIVPIGRFVLRAACVQNMAWQKHGIGPVRIAVNLSPRQFADEHLLRDIEDALLESGMPPDLLELEITESMVVQNVDRALELLRTVRQMGIHLAIDDFGTGYASMALIKQVPIDTIKIDRSFLRDVLTNPEDKAITEAIIALGKALDLTIVAEGVETAEQEAFLRERDCDEMQGFLFSRPIPGDDFVTFVSNHDLERLKALTGDTAPAPTRRRRPGTRRARR